VTCFSPKADFGWFLSSIERDRPLMIKFYKRRPYCEIPDNEYPAYVARIKEAYRRAMSAAKPNVQVS
jgi:hypothetical protein